MRGVRRIIPVPRGMAWPAARLVVSRFIVAGLLSAMATGCQLSQSRATSIDVVLTADGETRQLSVRAGSTVAQALAQAGIAVKDLDRSNPPFYTVLRNADTIKFTRVEEKFRTESAAIPFERQTLRNESLPQGQERLVQTGMSGEQELTYRAILEDGTQTSEAIVKTVVLREPVPEIVMVGAQSSFAPVPIAGQLAYAAAGNAWIIDTSTANRRLIVSSGDLDGRIFSLSPDGRYLLFTRRSKKPADQQINTLWAIRTDSASATPTSLNAANIVHFAAWYPGSSNAIAYSTVEPRGTAPGWQANNDLYRVTIGGQPRRILDARSGGVYGWWGMSFAFSPNGRLAYSKPDGIGLVSQDGGYLAPLQEIVPLQTHGDWAWTTPLAWGSDSQTLYYVDHVAALPPVTAEESPNFDLAAVSLSNNSGADFAPQTGMFAYPASSPVRPGSQEQGYEVAYLQAIFPDQSDTSRYRLVVMDRDGSNRRVLFPAADLPGLDPQTPAWSPAAVTGQSGDYLCVIYQGNLWLIDGVDGGAIQVTADGLASRVDWR